MGFDDLEEAEEENSQGTGTEPDQTAPEQTSGSSTTTETTASSAAESESVNDEQAFPFSETEQDALYARPDAWEQFDDLLDLELEMELRDREIRNVSKSEKYDAVLRVITQHPEEVADQIEQAREL